MSFANHNITLRPYRSAQSVCPAVCVPLAWCQMETAVVSLKTFVHVSITERNIKLERAFKMAATHGIYKYIYIFFSFFISIVFDSRLISLTAHVRTENGSAP